MKVECIRGFDELKQTQVYMGEIYPVVGMVYTVRNITTFADMTGYRFHEIINKLNLYRNGLDECSFHSAHFRRVTDISALTQLTKVRELEDV